MASGIQRQALKSGCFWNAEHQVHVLDGLTGGSLDQVVDAAYHHQAAGMDVATSSVAALRDAFAEVARARLDEEDLSPVLRADLAIDLEAVDLQLVHWLDYLGPHGMGNPAPTFLARDVTLERAKVVGENHLKATLRQGRASVDAIGFRLADEYPPERVSEGRYDAAIRLERNEFRGSVRVQARLLGIRPWEPVT